MIIELSSFTKKTNERKKNIIIIIVIKKTYHFFFFFFPLPLPFLFDFLVLLYYFIFSRIAYGKVSGGSTKQRLLFYSKHSIIFCPSVSPMVLNLISYLSKVVLVFIVSEITSINPSLVSGSSKFI